MAGRGAGLCAPITLLVSGSRSFTGVASIFAVGTAVAWPIPASERTESIGPCADLLKLRKRLGITGPSDSPVPRKPEGMRKATCARLKQKIEQVQWELRKAASEWYSEQWDKDVKRALKKRNQGRNGAIAR